MPAKDRYHDKVKGALIKDSWTIVEEQYTLSGTRGDCTMDTVVEKTDVVYKEIVAYAKPPVNGKSYLTQSEDGKEFAVVDVVVFDGKRYADAGLIVRIEGDLIIIERDMNDKPLVDALVQAGIPRSQIILAYAGEAVETPA